MWCCLTCWRYLNDKASPCELPGLRAATCIYAEILSTFIYLTVWRTPWPQQSSVLTTFPSTCLNPFGALMVIVCWSRLSARGVRTSKVYDTFDLSCKTKKYPWPLQKFMTLSHSHKYAARPSRSLWSHVAITQFVWMMNCALEPKKVHGRYKSLWDFCIRTSRPPDHQDIHAHGMLICGLKRKISMAATKVYDTFAFAQVGRPTIKILMLTRKQNVSCMNVEVRLKANKYPWPLHKFMTLLHSRKSAFRPSRSSCPRVEKMWFAWLLKCGLRLGICVLHKTGGAKTRKSAQFKKHVLQIITCLSQRTM